MGHTAAAGFADQVAEGNIQLEIALGWHLSSNHYPPVPSAFIASARDAIAAGEDEEWDRDIALPKGCADCRVLLPHDDVTGHEGHEVGQAVTWRDDRDVVRAGDLIESLHLDSFLSF